MDEIAKDVESRVGEIFFVEEEKKTWPIVGTILIVAFSVLFLFVNEFVPIVLAVWIIFILYQTYRLCCKRTFKFGARGYVLYDKRLNNTKVKVVMYDQVSEPNVKITRRQNSFNTIFFYKLDYGTVKFNYSFGSMNNHGQFDFQCSHLLYRCRSLYLTGVEQDYSEDEWLQLSDWDY